MRRWAPWVRGAATIVVVGAPVCSHVLPRLGRGDGALLGVAVAQAVAAGVLLSGALARRRWLGAALTAVLLGGILWGAAAGGGPAGGVRFGAGLSHATLYAGLLLVFGTSLLPGREAVVTGVARRISPHFHAGKVPYTRAVTAAWCLFFAGQLVASALLLLLAPAWWFPFVTTLHVPLVALMMAGELLVRRWRWRHERSTGLADTLRGLRRIRATAAAAGTSAPAAGCPARSGSATPRRPAPPDSGPGPAG